MTSNAAEEESPLPLSTFEVVYASYPPTAYPASRNALSIPAMIDAEVKNLDSSGASAHSAGTNVLRESLALYADNSVVALCGNGDDVEVDRRSDNTSVVVVGVISGDLTASADRESSTPSRSAP